MADRLSASHDANADGGAGPSCAFCETHRAGWMHRLDSDKAGFRLHGKGHTWADLAGVCDRCERLYRAGNDEGLNAVRDRSWPGGDAAVQEYLDNSLAAFRRADNGAISLDQWWPTGVPELVAAGFTPLEDLTGNVEIAADWPEQYRHSVPETRPGWEDQWHDGRCWLVRSPWPSIPVDEVISLLWEWVFAEHHPRSGPVTAEDEAARTTLVRQFLHADEAWAQEFRRNHTEA